MLLRRRILNNGLRCYNYTHCISWFSGQEKKGLQDSSKNHKIASPSIYGTSITIDEATHCYVFDGKSGLLFNCPSLKNILSGAQSLSFWFKCTDSDRRLLFSNETDYPYNMELSTGSSGITFRYYIDGSPDYMISSSAISLKNNTWYHMVIAHTSMSKCEWYIDKVLKYTYTGSTSFKNTVSDKFRWGSDSRIGSSAPTCFGGYMADMRIYDYTLNSSDVTKIYDEGSKFFIKK